FVSVAVIAESQAFFLRGPAELVERFTRLQRVVTRERVAVRNPRAHHPGRAEGLRLRQRTTKIVAQPLESHVRRLAAQSRGVHRGAHFSHGVLPQSRAFDLTES